LTQAVRGQVKELVVGHEVIQGLWMNQQNGFRVFRRGLCQLLKRVAQVKQQVFGIVGVADEVADFSRFMNRLGKRAEVQADHRFFKPLFCRVDNAFRGKAGHKRPWPGLGWD